MLNLPMSTFPQQFRTTVLDYWFTVGKEGKKTLFSILLSSLTGALHIILTKGISTREKRSSLMHAWDRHIAELSDEYLKGVAKTGPYIIS